MAKHACLWTDSEKEANRGLKIHLTAYIQAGWGGLFIVEKWEIRAITYLQSPKISTFDGARSNTFHNLVAEKEKCNDDR